MKKKTFVLLFLLVSLFASHHTGIFSQTSRMVYGVTIDAVNNLNSIVASLAHHSYRMTTRIVFDEWQPATNYAVAVNRIDSVSNIMGEILDSYYVKDYSIQQYKDRSDEYITAFGGKVDIWEIGNEVNGEWLGPRDSVMAKIFYAFTRAEKMNYVTAMTLYYNHNCWSNPRHEMFRWIHENVNQKMKYGLDYVFVSYYEDDCNNYQPNWQQVFDSLHVIFPNSKLGIGECGTSYSNRKEEYINRYYSMNITSKGFIGGYFWWYYKQDCVPWTTKPLWQVLENAIVGTNVVDDGDWRR